MNDIEHILTSPFHPESDSIVEKPLRIVKESQETKVEKIRDTHSSQAASMVKRTFYVESELGKVIQFIK